MVDSWRTPLRWVLATFMIVLGVLHFVATDAFAQIVPPQLPWPHALVWISGVFEILLGLGLIPEKTRRLAGWGLVALYIAVFPANIYMAVANVRIRDLAPIAPALLWGRLPFQAVFIAWALWVSKPRLDSATASGATEF
jgi:uncharacterized membrane protein